ncbi:transcriptional repressor CcpN [Carnobacterium maltaromaticum]|uniref:helix-turn-helix transcriptional regulator n=1 Tax=Carnobacterium maltaromaticum TaxID=2751 RepID=UPI000C7638F8|nr:helix-turn-helix transcriptional regulator [Carnobacterium maltaromaticum]PLS32517.1 transcriptional repressor CcpN [Carnobacterium maltaromaticum]PLS32898.1 transcriptional repressor CcpN [Carnobacterium maltaromaticum]PLS32957.1 transcriptional repressor CcpN [Carnobacterium maltaromaticum]PLS41574.1 transcriptional repressor CcpN [Carnobacterium maltaromaticum]PLS49472.1 transcriptional repressor CcpN [Carnobacterium maltaromaticum]
MELTTRQKKIIQIVKTDEPISADNIAKQLSLSKPTLRSDLAILTMTGILDARPKVGYFFSGQNFDPLLFDDLYEKKITEIMVPPINVKKETTVSDAVTMLFMHDVGTLYVVENDELLGVISRKDLLRSTISSTDTHIIPVAMIMTRMPNVITIQENERILDAGYKIIQHEIDSIPVVDTQNPLKVIGKISKTVVLKHFINEALHLNR